MSERAEKLQDAIGLVSDEYVEEAHGGDEGVAHGATASGAPAPGTPAPGAFDAHGAPGAPEARAQGAPAPDAPDARGAAPQARRTSWKRRAIAAAACLAVVAGVGAFAMAGLQAGVDAAPDAVKAEPVSERVSSGSASGSTAAETALTDAVTVNAAPADGSDAVEAEYGEAPLAAPEGSGAVEDVSGAVADVDIAAGADGGSEAVTLLTTGTIAAGGAEADEARAGLLTAAEWNDNENWPFFTNLVNAGTIGFPSFGIDPRHRVCVTVSDGSGTPVRGERVSLLDAAGGELWQASSGKDGTAYLFYRDGSSPDRVVAASSGASQAVSPSTGAQQGAPIVSPVQDVSLTIAEPSGAFSGDEQVMFIVDTTGSMSDEIAYLQADFAAIAAEAGGDGVTYSANFYRDHGAGEAYVTKCNPFTSDVSLVQEQLNDEYADGGGDTPEAVADILTETITENGSWRDDAAKIAFLVFDAPPHEGTDDEIDAAVRSAAERGIRVVPVVASNASRDTELFGRALAACTGASYVFLTDDSGIGDAHLEPIVGDYTVEALHDIIVRLIREAR